MKRILGLVMVLSCFVSTSVLAVPAPTELSPLQQMLAFVPDTTEIRAGEVSYVDFQALITSRPGAAQSKNYQDWLAVQSNKTPEAGRFMAALQGISIGSSELVGQFIRPEGMVKALGIDPFTIQRALTFGTPPSTALVLDGTFDPAAVGKALETRMYQKQPDLGGFALWCSADGCDSGAKLDPSKRDHGNPFGGNLGRQQAVAGNAAQVFSSASYPLVHAMANASQNPQLSLAAEPEYLATAGAFRSAGTVIQAYFLNLKFTKDAASTGQAKAGFVPIPAYSLISLGHVAHDNDELALIALVYDSESDAKTAQDVILVRIPKYTSTVGRRSLVDLIAERQGTLEPPQIYHDGPTGKYVLVLTLSTPIESSDATPVSDQTYRSSGMLFRFLVSSVMRRDAGWLAIEFSAPSR